MSEQAYIKLDSIKYYLIIYLNVFGFAVERLAMRLENWPRMRHEVSLKGPKWVPTCSCFPLTKHRFLTTSEHFSFTKC